MRSSKIAILSVLMLVMLLAIPSISAASTPTLNPPPSTLPGITYYVLGSQGTHYTITDVQWKALFSNIIDNSSYISYNWSRNLTQYLIIFDLNYTGLNPYGMAFVSALMYIGFDSVANMSKAFNMTKNLNSQISGYTNIQALDAGAYPGYSWSVPITNNSGMNIIYFGILFAVVASIVILYYVFNRNK